MPNVKWVVAKIVEVLVVAFVPDLLIVVLNVVVALVIMLIPVTKQYQT